MPRSAFSRLLGVAASSFAPVLLSLASFASFASSLCRVFSLFLSRASRWAASSLFLDARRSARRVRSEFRDSSPEILALSPLIFVLSLSTVASSLRAREADFLASALRESHLAFTSVRPVSSDALLARSFWFSELSR